MSGWVKWRGREAKRRMAKGNDKAIFATLSVVGEKANTEVPLDEGALQNSQYIKVEDGKGLISYGGGEGTGHPIVPYAKKWHELRDEAGNTYDPNFQNNRKDRYLADPFNSLAERTYKKSLKEEVNL